MIKMFDPFLTWAARRYQAAVATELKKYGLRYEDLYDPLLNMVRANCTTCFHSRDPHSTFTCFGICCFLIKSAFAAFSIKSALSHQVLAAKRFKPACHLF